MTLAPIAKSIEGVPDAELQRQIALFREIKLARQLLHAVPNAFVVLNQQRQIVFANKAFENHVHKKELLKVLGQRLGPCLGCIHAPKTNRGCGTTAFCQECGANKAIQAGLTGQTNQQECRITTVDGEALELRVVGTPLDIEGEAYLAFHVADISHEKRRRVLERIFFHDIGNTIMAIQGAVQLLKVMPEEENIHLVDQFIHRLIDEFNSQRELTLAENNELQLTTTSVHCHQLIQDLATLYSHAELAKDKVIVSECGDPTTVISTDQVQLMRILSNMMKNALEATGPGETVTVGYQELGPTIEFYVKNPEVMPQSTRLQVFNRSFSTKGQGRGTGTYSMKLLGERYLQGWVSFSSKPNQGTIFRIRLPYQLAQDDA